MQSSDDEPEYYIGHHCAEYDEIDQGRMTRIPFYHRERGPRYPGLVVIGPADPLFDLLINYQYYRLLEISHKRDAQALKDALKRQKAPAVYRRGYSAREQFQVRRVRPHTSVRFPYSATEEVHLNNLTEAQSFALLPRYLNGTAQLQFLAVRFGSRTIGVRCWPEAIQYLLTTYATPSAIREAT